MQPVVGLGIFPVVYLLYILYRNFFPCSSGFIVVECELEHSSVFFSLLFASLQYLVFVTLLKMFLRKKKQAIPLQVYLFLGFWVAAFPIFAFLFPHHPLSTVVSVIYAPFLLFSLLVAS
ncbi:MAG: hypothetical protein N3A54_05915 [Patescibacteria group bacterium]|nr:hypothetical protein [Patescibacteria group bacterium]